MRIVQISMTNMSRYHSFHSPSVYGGAAGYRPRVRSVFILFQRSLDIYNTYLKHVNILLK